MLRVLLILVLAFAVGVGWVGRDVGCSDDECGLGAEADGGDEGDDCPALCGGCARVAVAVAVPVEPALVIQPARTVAPFAIQLPTSSPRPSGLFRPPRA